MNWLAIGMFVIKSATRVSVTQVVMNAVDFTTPIGASRANVFVSKVGGYIISDMIAGVAVNHVVNEIANFIPATKTTEE